MIKEFKEFINKGNVMDMAVGVIIGGAFGTIVTSLVNDIIMPVISLVTGGIDFSGWFVSLNGQKYATLAEAEEAGASVLAYGKFISAVIYFVILAFIIFLIVKAMNKMKKKKEEEKPAKSDEVKLLEEIRDELKNKKK
jgi:large conductance mechanosensitive channel